MKFGEYQLCRVFAIVKAFDVDEIDPSKYNLTVIATNECWNEPTSIDDIGEKSRLQLQIEVQAALVIHGLAIRGFLCGPKFWYPLSFPSIIREFCHKNQTFKQ